MISRRALLAQLAGATILTPGATLARTSDRPLRRAAAAKGILFGTAAANYELRDHDFLKLLPRQAAILVAEYEMKRNILEPARGVYDFSASDALVEYARAYGLKFRGHTLVWYAANPHWLADAVLHSRNETLMTGYIDKIARHLLSLATSLA
jgi:endo-1,4-beta-xylanase